MDALDQIGDTVIDSIAAYFKAERNVKIVDNLQESTSSVFFDAEQPVAGLAHLRQDSGLHRHAGKDDARRSQSPRGTPRAQR